MTSAEYFHFAQEKVMELVKVDKPTKFEHLITLLCSIELLFVYMCISLSAFLFYS